MRGWRTAWLLLRQTWKQWRQDDALQWGAALAFYAVFSLAPILLIAIAVAGLLFEPGSVQGRILDQVHGLVGADGARLVEQMIQGAAERGSGGVWATVAGGAAVLVGATTVFAQLKVALNRIWGVRQRPLGWRGFLRRRVLAFGLVLAVGFLLLVALVASAALAALDGWILGLARQTYLVMRVGAAAITFGVVTLLFALIFRVLPDVEIAWRNVWWGAAATALLFTIGKHAMGLYLGNSGTASAYGAAGAFVVILLWVYYSSQILLVGAEFTQVYARHRGGSIQPEKDTLPVTSRP